MSSNCSTQHVELASPVQDGTSREVSKSKMYKVRQRRAPHRTAPHRTAPHVDRQHHASSPARPPARPNAARPIASPSSSARARLPLVRYRPAAKHHLTRDCLAILIATRRAMRRGQQQMRRYC